MSVDNDTGGVDLRICYERFDRRATLNVDEIYPWTDDEGKGKGETDKERERNGERWRRRYMRKDRKSELEGERERKTRV